MLARALDSLWPLLTALDPQPRLAVLPAGPGDAARIRRRFESAARDRERRPWTLVAETELDRLDAFERAATLGAQAGLASDAARDPEPSVDRMLVSREDGVTLRTMAIGAPDRPAIALVVPCGMPTGLCASWQAALAREHRVVTWETRGMFEPFPADSGWGVSLRDQTRDLWAVVDAYGIERAHVMGLCGGGAVAIDAAAAEPERVLSLGVWYGDLNLGPTSPRTRHQEELQDLLMMAASDLATADTLRSMLAQTCTLDVAPDLLHFVLYPYASARLLHAYGRLNGALMETDLRPSLARVRAPTLMVTSERDRTADPRATRQAAAMVPRAELVFETAEDHLSLFGAPPHSVALARQFLAAQVPG